MTRISRNAAATLALVLMLPVLAACNGANGEAANPCAAKQANPCAAKALNPCAAKQANPCAAKALNPCAAKQLNPCAAKALNPCAAKQLNPCAAKALNPCAAKQLNPCAAKALAANPCGMKGANPCNPCGAALVNPCRIKQPAGTTLAGGRDLVARGETLWNDRTLGKSGLACSNCHLGQYAQMNASFAKPYPHAVAMPKQQAGLEQVSASEMVQFCMVVPMAADPLPWDSEQLAALTAYVESIQPGYRPAANPCGAAANPCNPCAMKKNPCAR